MICTEFLEDEKFVRHYSNERKKILQVETGLIYDDAIDINPCNYNYIELDLLIDTEQSEEIVDEEKEI